MTNSKIARSGTAAAGNLLGWSFGWLVAFVEYEIRLRRVLSLAPLASHCFAVCRFVEEIIQIFIDFFFASEY